MICIDLGENEPPFVFNILGDYEAAAVRDPCAQWAAHRESACRDFADLDACASARASEADACALAGGS